MGEEGIEKIFAYSVRVHGKEVSKKSNFVLSDTTVQENNTTFPSDAKLCRKVIDKCNEIAQKGRAHIKNGEKGVQINAMMAATAWNLKKMMEKLKEEFLFFVFRFIFQARCSIFPNLNVNF